MRSGFCSCAIFTLLVFLRFNLRPITPPLEAARKTPYKYPIIPSHHQDQTPLYRPRMECDQEKEAFGFVCRL